MRTHRGPIRKLSALLGWWFWTLAGSLQEALAVGTRRSIDGTRAGYRRLPDSVRSGVESVTNAVNGVIDRSPRTVQRAIERTAGAGRTIAVPATEADRERRRILLMTVPFFVLATFGALVPLAYLSRMSVSADNLRIDGFTWEAWGTVLTESTYHTVAFNTLWFAALAAAVSVAIGVALSHALEKYSLPFENVLVALISFPIALPGIVVAFLVIVLLGRQGLLTNAVAFFTGSDASNHATASVFGLFVGYVYSLVPRATMVLRGTYAECNTEAEEAARALGATPFQTFVRVTLPEIRPGVVGAFVLTFRTALAIFGTVLVLGGLSVATLRIDRELSIGFNSQVAAVIGIVYFVFILAFTLVGLRYTETEVVEI